MKKKVFEKEFHGLYISFGAEEINGISENRMTTILTRFKNNGVESHSLHHPAHRTAAPIALEFSSKYTPTLNVVAFCGTSVETSRSSTNKFLKISCPKPVLSVHTYCQFC